jgi:hypothetical protein
MFESRNLVTNLGNADREIGPRPVIHIAGAKAKPRIMKKLLGFQLVAHGEKSSMVSQSTHHRSPFAIQIIRARADRSSWAGAGHHEESRLSSFYIKTIALMIIRNSVPYFGPPAGKSLRKTPLFRV